MSDKTASKLSATRRRQSALIEGNPALGHGTDAAEPVDPARSRQSRGVDLAHELLGETVRVPGPARDEDLLIGVNYERAVGRPSQLRAVHVAGDGHGTARAAAHETHVTPAKSQNSRVDANGVSRECREQGSEAPYQVSHESSFHCFLILSV